MCMVHKYVCDMCDRILIELNSILLLQFVFDIISSLLSPFRLLFMCSFPLRFNLQHTNYLFINFLFYLFHAPLSASLCTYSYFTLSYIFFQFVYESLLKVYLFIFGIYELHLLLSGTLLLLFLETVYLYFVSLSS